MRTNEIRKAVFRIIEKYTHIEIKSDTLLRDDAGLDSMDQVEICNDIESEFNLIIEDSELFTPESGECHSRRNRGNGNSETERTGRAAEGST